MPVTPDEAANPRARTRVPGSAALGGPGGVRSLGELSETPSPACTHAAVHWGFDRGADLAALQASDMGLPIYEAMGFETVSHTRMFIAPGPR